MPRTSDTKDGASDSRSKDGFWSKLFGFDSGKKPESAQEKPAFLS
jgi:hypothetical protein